MKSLKDDDILFFIQKRAAISIAVFSTVFAIINLISFKIEGNVELTVSLYQSIFILLLAAVLFFITGLFNKPVFRFLQVSIFLMLGFIGTVIGDAGEMVGPTFVSLAFIYAFQYGILHTRPHIKIVVFAVIYIIFVTLVTVVVHESPFILSAMTIFMSILIFYLVWIAFTPMLKESEKQQEKLRQDIAENRVFVKLGRNVTGTVHNIRSKLATVRTYGQLMKIATSEEAAEYLAKQEAASADIIAMLENLLANVRAYGDVQMMPCDLNEYVRICLDFKKADLDFKHGVHVTTAFSPEATILGDPKDLATIIESLLDNAQEAMTGRKDRNLSVSTVEERHTIKLSIVDNGPGLHFCDPCRYNNECLTCPEFKIGRSTKKKGSGVGMTLARESIAKLGADMRIESGAGKGAAVHIWFPRFKEIAKEQEAV